MVFPYVESHNFYVEHWYHTIFWNKVREFGALLARHGFFADAEDIFFLQRHEVSDALVDLRLAWAAGADGARARLLAADRAAAQGDHGGDARAGRRRPRSARCPRRSREPMTIMLWGITDRAGPRVGRRRPRRRPHADAASPASPGTAEGPRG